MPNSNIMKTSAGSRVFLAASAILIVAYGIYNWTVSPQTSYLHAARLYETMVTNAGKRTEMIKKQVGTKEAEIARLQREIAESRDSFFTTAKAREFFSDLEPISLQCNCSIESLNFTTATPVSAQEAKKGSSPVSLRHAMINLLGRYEDVIKFFNKLSSYSQRISVNELYIESTEYKSDELSCNVTITIYLIEDEDKETVTDEQKLH